MSLAPKYIPPSVSLSSFSCPHCGTLAKQFWYTMRAQGLKKDQVPNIIDDKFVQDFPYKDLPTEIRESMKQWHLKMLTGEVFFDQSEGHYLQHSVNNLALSQCYACDKIAVWLNTKMLSPAQFDGPRPNSDLPQDVISDYIEAAAILNHSPRGAAALLRLAVQKLCRYLGEKGDNINEDISSLVKKGLDPKIQKALDIVRVVGNSAVHPGNMDIKDDRPTAESLFQLVNLIAERMLTESRHINEMFDALPSSARDAIVKRDKNHV